MNLDVIFSIVVLIMSVVVHEVSHGYAAHFLGDPTARIQGRLSLNPIKHLDFLGSILVPFISYSMGGFIFGWAKPVPFNPYNLRNQRWGELYVAIAGPVSNLVLAVFFGILIRLSFIFGFATQSFITIASTIVFINIILAIFNLMPIPPLDGSKVLFSFLPLHMQNARNFMEKYSFILLIIFILVIWKLLFPVVKLLFVFLTGMAI